MFKQLMTLVFLLSFLSCSRTSEVASTGEVVSSTGIQSFQAKYNGKEPLRIGDRVNIIEQQAYSEDLRIRESRNMPFMTDKQNQKIIGQASVSNILNDNFYEFKTDKPQHVPESALIQKL